MSTETLRTDASAFKIGRLPDDDWFRTLATDGPYVEADFARQLERELAAARAEVDEAKRNYLNACEAVAEIHAAAMGEVCGPRLGVVKDVAGLRAEVEGLKQCLTDITPTLSGGQGGWTVELIREWTFARFREANELRAANAALRSALETLREHVPHFRMEFDDGDITAGDFITRTLDRFNKLNTNTK